MFGTDIASERKTKMGLTAGGGGGGGGGCDQEEEKGRGRGPPAAKLTRRKNRRTTQRPRESGNRIEWDTPHVTTKV